MVRKTFETYTQETYGGAFPEHVSAKEREEQRVEGGQPAFQVLAAPSSRAGHLDSPSDPVLFGGMEVKT